MPPFLSIGAKTKLKSPVIILESLGSNSILFINCSKKATSSVLGAYKLTSVNLTKLISRSTIIYLPFGSVSLE